MVCVFHMGVPCLIRLIYMIILIFISYCRIWCLNQRKLFWALLSQLCKEVFFCLICQPYIPICFKALNSLSIIVSLCIKSFLSSIQCCFMDKQKSSVILETQPFLKGWKRNMTGPKNLLLKSKVKVLYRFYVLTA